MSVIVGYDRDDDPAWEEVRSALRERDPQQGGARPAIFKKLGQA